jgi:hypothetical protein
MSTNQIELQRSGSVVENWCEKSWAGVKRFPAVAPNVGIGEAFDWQNALPQL